MISRSTAHVLKGTSAIAAAILLTSAPLASAQDAAAPQPTPPAPTAATGPASPGAIGAAAQPQAENSATPEIVVTGTLFRRTDRETPSPVTVVTADDLAKRGINTISDAVQTLASNNSGALPNGFSANGGAFANGASAASLRGLTTDSTLVLFDGLRASYYPLSDDGTRNFVDLNTIPDSIVDRVEVLRDGASSTYGADAVAGVINVIIKKQIVGFEGTAEAGISQQGDGAEQRLSATYGRGDLGTDGYNIYLNAEYQRDAPIYLRNRGFPFNTDNRSSLTGQGVDADGNPATVYGVNGDVNGLNGDGSFSGAVGQSIVPIVRRASADGTFLPGSTYQLLNPSNGCMGLTRHDLGPSADGSFPGGTVCEQDLDHDYTEAQSLSTRFGTTLHGTVQVNDDTQAYAMFTYYQDKVEHTGPGAGIRAQTNTGDFDTVNIVLPPTLTDGSLNPNDPYAADGDYARIYYRFPNQTDVTSLSRTYRGAAGINGSFGDGFNYSVDLTGMKTDLTTIQRGYLYIQGLLDVVADGSYNFINPALNSQNTLDTLSPTNRSRASSQLYQGQFDVSKDLFQLPGGALQVGVGGAVRYESVDDPSANPDDSNNPTQQYFTINAFGAIGHRYVESAYFEINAPVFHQLEINGSGRYDHYSSGFSNFSPKVGVKFTPIPQVALRGTFSRGFRVPSFAESNSLPTIGFSNSGSLPDSFVQQHLTADGKPDAYASPYLLGLNTSGTPGLRPEKSQNITAGAVVQPLRWLSLTADYYHIKKTRVIVGADPTAAIAAYYAGDPIPTGFTITPDVPDDLHPDAMRRIFAVNYGFVNANKLVTSGIDLEATAHLKLADDIHFTSTVSGTYVLKYNETTADGTVEHFAGSLGPINITSGSGTPRLRGYWQNTLDAGAYSLSATAYYSGGYKTTSEDTGGNINDCSTISSGYYDDGVTPIQCHVRRFIDVDMTGAVKISDRLTLYANVLNILNQRPSVDYVTYGANGYNPAWTQSGIVGRFMRVGAHVKF